MILRAISRGLLYESDPGSTIQVETSFVESSLVGVYGERVLESL